MIDPLVRPATAADTDQLEALDVVRLAVFLELVRSRNMGLAAPETIDQRLAVEGQGEAHRLGQLRFLAIADHVVQHHHAEYPVLEWQLARLAPHALALAGAFGLAQADRHTKYL